MKKINEYMELNKDNPFSSQTKMLFHLDRVNEFLETGSTFPIFMEVMMANPCELACEWCITENRLDEKDNAKEMINMEPLLKFFKDFKTLGGKAVTFSGGGESTLHPNFDQAVLEARKQDLDCGLMTHGGFKESLIPLIGENFKWMRISLDTLNEEKYKKWKGKNFIPKILKNIKLLQDYPVKIGINVNVNDDMTVEEIHTVIEECYGITDYIQFRPVLKRYFKEEGDEFNNDVWDYLKQYENNSKINLSYDKLHDMKKNAYPFDKCSGHNFEPILDPSGEIRVCSYHSNKPEFSFGNINDNSMEEIWNSEKRKKVVKYVDSLVYEKVCQQQCKCSEVNKFIDFLKHPPEELDINFL